MSCKVSGSYTTIEFRVKNEGSKPINLQLSGSYYDSYAYDDQGNYYQTGIECSFSNQEFSQYSSGLTLPAGIMTKGRIRIKDVATDAASFPIVVLKTNQSSSLSFSNLAIMGRTAVALPEPSVTCQVTSCADGLDFTVMSCKVSGSYTTIDFRVKNEGSKPVTLRLSGSYYDSYAYDDQGNYYQTGIECCFSNQEFSQYSSGLTLPAGIMTKGTVRIKDVAADATKFTNLTIRTNYSNSLVLQNLSINR